MQTKGYADFMRVQEEVLLAIAAIAREKGCQVILPLHHYQMGGQLAADATAGIQRGASAERAASATST